MERDCNQQADTFVKVMSTMPAHAFAKLRFAEHMAASGTRKCKDLSMKLLLKYLVENPHVNPQQILGSPMTRVFEKWLNNQRMTDTTCSYRMPAPFVPETVPVERDQHELDCGQIFGPQNGQLVNQDLNDRLQRLSQFTRAAVAKADASALSKGHPMVDHCELEFLNHDIIFFRICAAGASRHFTKAKTDETGVKHILHNAAEQVVEVSVVTDGHEYLMAVQYTFTGNLPGGTRLLHLKTLSGMESKCRQLAVPLGSARKASVAQSSSTNCESSDPETSRVLRARTCHFEGDLRLIYSSPRLSHLELSLISMTRETSRFFGSADLLEICLRQVVGKIAWK